MNGVVKPDVAAPGDTIDSAWWAAAPPAPCESGTSMATPSAAGIAALVKQRHSGWTPEQLKAAVMNTASRDVTTGQNGTGNVYPPSRVGSGGVDAWSAVTSTSLAYNADGQGGVSASFGVISAPIDGGKLVQTRKVTVQNTGASAKSYTLSYSAATRQPGVSYSISPKRVTVPGRGSAQVSVSVTVDPTKLRRTLDPTMARTQNNPMLLNAAGQHPLEARQFLASASGRLLVAVAGSSTPPLRVPLFASARAISTTSSSVVSTATGRAIVQRGAGVSLDRTAAGRARYQSQLSVLTLGASSPKLKPCVGVQLAGCLAVPSAAGADLRYVGAGAATSSTKVPTLWFGISTWGNWSSLNAAQAEPMVLIDTNGDGETDYTVDVGPLPGTDLLYATVYNADLNSVGGQPVNFSTGAYDTNVFNTNTLLVPVDASLLGMKAGATTFPITYSVQVLNGYSAGTQGVQDATTDIPFDVANPTVKVGKPVYDDADGTTVDYSLAAGATTAQALVLHLYGADSKRAEVLTLKP